MPDITMCNNESCWLRHSCYRHMAPASSRQSWQEFEPSDPREETFECDYYMEIA